MHLLRNLKPNEAAYLALNLEPKLRDVWQALIGSPLTDGEWELATLPIKEGGIGVPHLTSTYIAAQLSSWLSVAYSSGLPSGPDAEFKHLLEQANSLAPGSTAGIETLCSSDKWPDESEQSFRTSWLSQSHWKDLFTTIRIKLFDSSAP